MGRPLVIVGRKDAMRYVTACVTLFNRGEREIVLRARGRNILKNGFYSNLRVKEISLGSDELRRGDGRVRHVGVLEAVIAL